jgi:ketosteroid isomerase-like protein
MSFLGLLSASDEPARRIALGATPLGPARIPLSEVSMSLAPALAVALGLASSLASAQPASSFTRIADQVVAGERAWSEAYRKHDLGAISGLLADDFVGIDGRGVVSDKAGELEEAKAPSAGSSAPVLLGEQLSDVRVRAYGDTAVLTAINTARFESEGSESTIRYRRTTVWVRLDGRWRCVSFHGSRILE